jgi:hypothetical protein
MSTRIMLKGVRLAFAQGLWTRSKPPNADANAKEKYRCALIIPPNHPQLAEVKAAIDSELKQTFGDKWAAIKAAAEKQEKICLRDGNLKDYAGYEGNMYLQTSSDIQPSVFGYNPKEGQVRYESGIVYSGCWVAASVDIKAFNRVSKGCSAYIRGVQLIVTPPGADDSALGGGTAASDDEFEEIGVSAGADPLVA